MPGHREQLIEYLAPEVVFCVLLLDLGHFQKYWWDLDEMRVTWFTSYFFTDSEKHFRPFYPRIKTLL